MYQEQANERWEQIKAAARLSWGRLTDDDFNRAEGSVERLYGIIHLKFGDTREAIRTRLDAPYQGNHKEPQRSTPSHEAVGNQRATAQLKPSLPVLGDTRDVIQASEGRLEVQLSQWSAALEALVAKDEPEGFSAKRDHRQDLHELTLKYHAARRKLEELKASGSEAWAGFAPELEVAWRELEVAFQKITN